MRRKADYKRLGKTRREWASGEVVITTRCEKEIGEMGAGEHLPRNGDSRGEEKTDEDVIICY